MCIHVTGGKMCAPAKAIHATPSAATAIIPVIHTKSGSAWGTAVGVVAMSAFIGAETSTDMASELMNEAENLQAMLMTWIITGVSVGAGAMLAMKIDEAME